MIRFRRSLWCVVFAVFASGSRAHGQERPEVAYVVPAAVRAGHWQEITLHGRNLERVTGLLADTPLDAKAVKRSPTQATFRVKAPKDAWIGIHQLRVLAPESVSAPRLFVIDELPLVRQGRGNHLITAAQSLSLPAAVVSQTSKGKVDYYRFKLDAPAALTFDVVARRLGTGPDTKLGGDETGRLLTIDPLLRILDAAGRELAFADDTPGLTADVRYRHRFEEPGEYLVSIHDVQFHGGPAHQYVLRIGDFPDAAAPYPVAGPTNTVHTTVKLFGVAGTESFEPSAVASASESLDGIHWIAARSRAGLHSLAMPHLASGLPEVTEIEPNDSPDVAQLITLPVACNGRLQTPEDVDCYALKLPKGQRVRVTTIARTVGSTAWPGVRVLGVDGKQIAATPEQGNQVPEGSPTDPRLDPPPVTFTAAADGRHVIQVFRRVGQAGPAAVYRLEIEPFAGSFTLRPKTDYLAVPRGGTAVFAVDVQREEYGGPLEVTAISNLAKVCAPTTFVPGSPVNPALVTVTVTADAKEEAGWFVVLGRANIGGREVRRYGDLTSLYDAPPGLRPNQGQFFFLRPLPRVVTRRLALLVTAPAPFTLAGPEKPIAARPGDTVTLPITCHRVKGFANAVAVRLEGLPGKPVTGLAAIAKNANQGGIPLKIPGNLAPGRYTVVVVGEATVQGRQWTNATPALTLIVGQVPNLP